MPTAPGTKGELFPPGDAALDPRAVQAYTGHVGGRAKISAVGDRSVGILACPKCGSTQFKAKRSMKGKLAAGLLAPKTQVKCEACGTMYKRG